MINLKPYKNGEQNNNLDDINYDETRDLVLRGDDIQARTEFFSQVPGGTKFVIPFFSEEKEHKAKDTVRPELPVGRE